MKKYLAALLSLSLLAGCSASVGDQMYEKYGTIIDALEEENFDAAIQEISQMKKEKLIAEAGDINDYITTVTLTNDNFYDYFELKKEPVYNSFGELQEDSYCLILKSKKYDEGLLLYDSQALNTMRVEAKQAGYESTIEFSLAQLLYGARLYNEYEITRVTEGEIKFISSDYVESEEITQTADANNKLNVKMFHLKDGSVFVHTEKENYPY